MTYENMMEQAEHNQAETLDQRALDKRLQDAAEIRPGTFRYSDSGLKGEVRTSASHEDGAVSHVRAEVYRRDGTSDVVGTARFHMNGDAAVVHNEPFTAQNYGVENALLDEVTEKGRSQGATKLQGWAPDDNPDAARRWSRLGFQPTARDPGAAGTHWERPIGA